VIPSPPWNRVPPRSSIRRRDPLNRKAIVDAAIRILDVDGLDGGAGAGPPLDVR
jgi:hypothetical protein